MILPAASRLIGSDSLGATLASYHDMKSRLVTVRAMAAASTWRCWAVMSANACAPSSLESTPSATAAAMASRPDGAGAVAARVTTGLPVLRSKTVVDCAASRFRRSRSQSGKRVAGLTWNSPRALTR